MEDYFAWVPTEVLATIFSGLPTSDRHGRRFGSARLGNPSPADPVWQQHLLKRNSSSLKTGAYSQGAAPAAGMPPLAYCAEGYGGCMADPAAALQNR